MRTETFPERVARISREQNVSVETARRIATSMIRLEKRIIARRVGVAS